VPPSYSCYGLFQRCLSPERLRIDSLSFALSSVISLSIKQESYAQLYRIAACYLLAPFPSLHYNSLTNPALSSPAPHVHLPMLHSRKAVEYLPLSHCDALLNHKDSRCLCFIILTRTRPRSSIHNGLRGLRLPG